MIEKCAQCGKEIDVEQEASTQCSKCKKWFCCAMWSTCFSDHNGECGGTHETIMNPSFVINLMPLKKD